MSDTGSTLSAVMDDGESDDDDEIDGKSDGGACLEWGQGLERATKVYSLAALTTSHVAFINLNTISLSFNVLPPFCFLHLRTSSIPLLYICKDQPTNPPSMRNITNIPDNLIKNLR